MKGMMTTAAAAIIDTCQRRLDKARHGGTWFSSGGETIDHGTYRTILAPYHDRVYHEGRVTWAALVLAQQRLYAPGDLDSTAMVVYSFDKYFDANPHALERIAGSCGALKTTIPKDAILVTFAAEVRNDNPREIDRQVPVALTAGRQVRYETLYVQRHRLPTGYLAAQFFPVIISPSQPTQPMLLPLELWAPELIEAWKEAARKKPVATPQPEPRQTIPGFTGAAATGGNESDGGFDPVMDAFAENPLKLSPTAAASLKLAGRQHGLETVKVRVTAAQRANRLDFTEEEPNPATDFVYDSGGITVVVDIDSARALTGLTVDLAQSPQGIGFVFRRVA